VFLTLIFVIDVPIAYSLMLVWALHTLLGPNQIVPSVYYTIPKNHSISYSTPTILKIDLPELPSKGATHLN